MNTFTKDSLKKLLFVYLAALGLVAVYFLVSTLFKEEKSIELKSFKQASDGAVQEIIIEKEEEEEDERPFLMLPKR